MNEVCEKYLSRQTKQDDLTYPEWRRRKTRSRWPLKKLKRFIPPFKYPSKTAGTLNHEAFDQSLETLHHAPDTYDTLVLEGCQKEKQRKPHTFSLKRMKPWRRPQGYNGKDKNTF